MDQKKITKRNRIMFPLGTVGRDMMYQLFTNFLYTFVLFTKGLSKSQLTVIAAIMIAARVFDALNDPLMGNIIDRTRTKWGKFKPWLVIGILTTSLVIYAAFNVNLKGWPFVIFFGFIYFMYSITYTMHDISYWGMIPSLSTDAAERNLLTSRTNLFAGIGATLATVLIPMLTVGTMTIGRSTVTAYGIIAAVVAVLGPLFLAFTIFGVRENRDYEKEPAPKVSFKKIINTIMGNDQLRWIVPIFLLQQIGNGFIVGGIGSTYIYFQFGYAGGLYSTFSIIGMAATAVLMVLYPVISAKMQRKSLMKKLLIASMAGYVLMLIAGLFSSGLQSFAFPLLTIGFMISNLGQYGFYLIMMISILNTVEYNEYNTGNRDDAIIAAVRPFVTKLGSALIIAITTISYLIFNVTDITKQISDLEQAAQVDTIGVVEEAALKAIEADKLAKIENVLKTVTKSQTVGLLLIMIILSFVFMLATYILYMKHYKLDEPEYERICRELEQRKA